MINREACRIEIAPVTIVRTERMTNADIATIQALVLVLTKRHIDLR